MGRIKIKQTLMDIRHIPQLTGITLDGKEISIGTLTTITDLMESQLIRDMAALPAETGDHFAFPLHPTDQEQHEADA